MKSWPALRRFLQNGGLSSRELLVGLDFDGTLSPLARRPALARLPAATRRLLLGLSRKRGVRVAVISGRGLADVKSRVGIGRLHYAGNHGLEIRAPGSAWSHPQARRERGRLKELAAGLRKALGEFPGALLEDKGLTLSVHYRQMSPLRHAALRRSVARLLKPHSRDLLMVGGKKVWEVRPKVRWNKGHALLRLAGGAVEAGGAAKGRRLLFVGDDATDEAGFRTLGRRALTVRVGPARKSAALFHLDGQRQVRALLELLCRTRP